MPSALAHSDPMHLEQPASPLPTLDSSPEPRLGILHLLVWTACVAVYCGLAQSLGLNERNPDAFDMTLSVLRSLGVGAALGGVLLWAARRRRGLAFPVHPGEYLLVVKGINIACLVLFYGGAKRSGLLDLHSLLIWRCLTILLNLIYGAALAWAIHRVKASRWRLFFIILGADLCSCCVSGLLSLGYQSLTVLGDIVLVGVLLKDRADGLRYPWPHWVGIGTKLWLSTIAAISIVRIVLTYNLWDWW
jgi:hypothetical protein